MECYIIKPAQTSSYWPARLHGPSMFAVRAKIYGVLYVTGSGILGLMEVHGRNLDFNIISHVHMS